MRQSVLDVNEKTGKIELGVRVDTSDTDAINAELRSRFGKGWSPDRTMRAVAEIPFDFLQALAASGDLDGVILYSEQATQTDKRVALRNLLKRYPEFTISDGHI